ncbi:hypothetical protein INR49_031821 [Caranx melampygus]|nr:hypothetical protein INR49_031821 [Caranx melampygus]
MLQQRADSSAKVEAASGAQGTLWTTSMAGVLHHQDALICVHCALSCHWKHPGLTLTISLHVWSFGSVVVQWVFGSLWDSHMVSVFAAADSFTHWVVQSLSCECEGSIFFVDVMNVFLQEEFCYPVECLALTVEEVMHIRQVLVKAELEKFQQYKEIYTALKKGKLCFSCRTKRFSLFTWSYTCQFCKRPVCSQCSKKMRLPSKPYSTLPIYSLGPSAMAKEEAGGASAPAEPEKNPFGFSKHGSKDDRSQDEPELPKELTEDWVAMEVCVDCKKFITEIISTSKRSLCVATKRARLNRKTQSFYMSSSSSVNFRPSERTINEV